jgi:hypothetical protein
MLKMINWRVSTASLASLVLILISNYGFEPTAAGHSMSLIPLLLREIGFALLIAVMIWLIFEYFSREESEVAWNRRINTITENVFFGVLGRNLPKEATREAHSLLLDQTFVRSGFHVNYVLTDDNYDIGTETRPYIKLNATARYVMKNIGNSKATLPVKIGLPNPILNELKSKCAVNRIIVKRNGNSEDFNLTTSEEEFRKSLENNSLFSVPFNGPQLDLSPDETVEIVFDYTMAKEEEDTEIGQTLYPTDSLSITVVDRNPKKRVVRARSIHPTELEDDTSAQAEGTYNFRLNRYVLPHQGFVIWWKKATELR